MRPLFSLLALTSFLALPAQDVLTLPVALRQAEQASFQADNASFALAAAQDETAQVRSLYLPELTAAGGHVSLDHTRELRTSAMTLGPFPVLGTVSVPPSATGVAEASSWQYKVGVHYLLWDFGRRGAMLSAARAKEVASTDSGKADVQRLQAEVTARYMTLLDAKARKLVLAQRHTALRDHLKTVEDMLKQGLVARNDYLRTEVALRGVEDADGAVDTAYANALEALNTSLGREPGRTAELPGALGAPPDIPWDEAAIRARALANNATVRALKAKVEALDRTTELDRRNFYPAVVAEAAHTYEENRFLVHPHENSLTVGMTWKVLDGGARSAKVQESATQAAQARRELLEAQRTAEAAAVAALRNFRQSLREAGTAKVNVISSEENFRIVEDQYREGMVRSTDALDAEAILAESRSALASKQYQAYAQQAALLALLGEDLAAFYETHLEK
ncbi:MAG TPA: TolC family protein [Holophaga sp.]|nr:TolC family protein [Holophaga sp.]